MDGVYFIGWDAEKFHVISPLIILILLPRVKLRLKRFARCHKQFNFLITAIKSD